MFGERFTLFTLVGLKIHADLSWEIPAFLVTWTLAACCFPTRAAALAASTYRWMGGARTGNFVHYQ